MADRGLGEVCAVGMGHNRGHGGTARVMVAHGVLLKTEVRLQDMYWGTNFDY